MDVVSTSVLNSYLHAHRIAQLSDLMRSSLCGAWRLTQKLTTELIVVKTARVFSVHEVREDLDKIVTPAYGKTTASVSSQALPLPAQETSQHSRMDLNGHINPHPQLRSI